MLFKLSAKAFSISVRCICKQTWNMEKHIAFGTKIIPVLELDDFEQLNLDQNTQQEQSPAETKAYVKTTQAYQCFWFMGNISRVFGGFWDKGQCLVPIQINVTKISISLKITSGWLLYHSGGKEGRHCKHPIELYSAVLLEAYPTLTARATWLWYKLQTYKSCVFCV